MPVSGLPGGSFSACVRKMRDEQGITDPRAFCAWKNHELSGKWPSEESLREMEEAHDFEEPLKESTGAFTRKIHEIRDARGNLSIRKNDGDPLAVFMDGVVFDFGKSGNGNTYGPQCVESAIKVFAGKPIRLDHPTRSEDRELPERSVGDQIGKLPSEEHFYVDETPSGKQGLMYEGAILSYSPSDRWVADRIKAGILGDVSLNGIGKVMREADDNFLVEEFVEGASLDLVTTAAAGGKAIVRESQSTLEVDMDAEEVRGIVQDSIKKLVKEKDDLAQLAEAEELTDEHRRLLEGAARFLREQEAQETMTEQEKKEAAMTSLTEQEPEQVGMLPEPVAIVWRDAFAACEGEESVCAHQAWLAAVNSLMTDVEEAEDEEDEEDEEIEEAEDEEKPVAEALAILIRAGVIKPGAISGMNTTRAVQESQRDQDDEDLEDFIERTIREATGDEKFAKAARRS